MTPHTTPTADGAPVRSEALLEIIAVIDNKRLEALRYAALCEKNDQWEWRARYQEVADAHAFDIEQIRSLISNTQAHQQPDAQREVVR